MPKISVIIPVYNAKDYIERCLDSVCNQTLKDIEIICVDDCSTDNSLEILNKYAKKYPQMKVIHHNINGGESKARNTGLDNATGEYIGFVDNDDKIDLDFYEKLYTKAKIENVDIAKGNCYEVDYNGQLINVDDNKILKQNGNNKFCFTTHWWTAIYRKQIILDNNITFRTDIILGGDIIFLNELLVLSKSFDVINDVYYYHYQRSNNTDSEYLSLDKIQSAIKAYSIIIKNLTNNYNKNIDKRGYIYAINYYLRAIYSKIDRNNSREATEICINAIFELFDLIQEKEFIENIFIKELPYTIFCIKTNNKAELIEFILNNNKLSISQTIFYRHKINMLKTKEYNSGS